MGVAVGFLLHCRAEGAWTGGTSVSGTWDQGPCSSPMAKAPAELIYHTLRSGRVRCTLSRPRLCAGLWGFRTVLLPPRHRLYILGRDCHALHSGRTCCNLLTPFLCAGLWGFQDSAADSEVQACMAPTRSL